MKESPQRAKKKIDIREAYTINEAGFLVSKWPPITSSLARPLKLDGGGGGALARGHILGHVTASDFIRFAALGALRGQSSDFLKIKEGVCMCAEL